jgi:uncharacterized membrane protein YjgN (DUF898 family)
VGQGAQAALLLRQHARGRTAARLPRQPGRFESALRFAPLCGLTLKNGLLIVLTLGLYWPFAAVALARMKLEAVSVVLQEDLEALADRARGSAGDAAGDQLGFDIGL